jgi:hypothetical protein
MRRDHDVLVSPILGFKPNKLGIKPSLLGLIPKVGQDATFVYHEHARFPRPFLIVHLATSAQAQTCSKYHWVGLLSELRLAMLLSSVFPMH